MSAATTVNRGSEIPEPNITRFLFADRRMAPLWLLLRLWLGYECLHAAWGKWAEGGWVGKGAGGAVKGFAQGAMAQTGGEHPQVTGWWGLDRWLLPAIGVPGYPGSAFGGRRLEGTNQGPRVE
jgi:thiosulfate dehydrogenase [quinone] large subunit